MFKSKDIPEINAFRSYVINGINSTIGINFTFLPLV